MAKKKSVKKVKIDDLFSGLTKTIGGKLLNQFRSKYFIDTGNLAINFINSGRFMGGGIPTGITECYGPAATAKSLLGMTLLGSCQRMGGYAILHDQERAANAVFACKAAHVDENELITFDEQIPHIESLGEKIVAVTDYIREKKGPDVPILHVWDSIGVAMTKREWDELGLPENATAAQIKAAGGNEKPGERAKAAGKLLRKINPYLNNNNASMFVINQTRMKIGVLYGCFHYNTRVVMADGTKKKIGWLVNNKIDDLVMSYNVDTGKIEPKKIIDWHDNGNLDEGQSFLQFVVRKRGENGRTSFACTENHMIFVPKKEVKGDFLSKEDVEEKCAGEIEVGDSIAVTQPYYLSFDQKQVVYGSILGDGSIRFKDDSCSSLRISHGLKQKQYCQWKQEIFSPWVGYSGESSKYNKYSFSTIPMYELNHLKFRFDKKCYIPEELADEINELGLAIWYMDDGTYSGNYSKWGKGKSCIYCSKFENREILFKVFDKFGLNPKLKEKGFFFNAEDTYKLHKLICKYVIPSMNYKIHPSLRNEFCYEIEDVNDEDIKFNVIASKVLDIYEKPPTKTKKKFDLTIEGNHTYIVDGAIVHNSPETTAGGGEALPFYANCRIRTGVKGKIENKKLKLEIGTKLKIQNRKSRSCAPFMWTDEIPLYFSSGIDPLGGLLRCLEIAERIEQAGKGWWIVKNEYTSDGKEYKFQASKANNTLSADVLLDNPAIIDAENKEQVVDYLNIFSEAIKTSGSENIETTKDIGDYDDFDIDSAVDDIINDKDE